MKTNKINFDWSIFIAVMTIFVVIVCGVVCCCLALPSNDNGIAKAQENDDYLVAPGESYTTMQSCESMFQNYDLSTYSNIVYFNFNFQYDELEFFNRFSVVIDDFGSDYGGLDDSFYFYPLMSFKAERGSYDPTCFTVIVLGWDDYSSESGIYIMDDNFDASSFWKMIDVMSNHGSFITNYGEFIFAKFTKGYDVYNLNEYFNLVTNNFIWLDSFHNLYFNCYFDSSFITDYLDGYETYDESIVSYLDRFMSANGVFNKNAVYVAPDDSGFYGSSNYNFKGYMNFNYNVKNTYLNTLSSDFNSYVQNSNDFYYNEQYELYVIASCSISDEFQMHFGFRYGISDMLSVYSEEEGRFIPNQLIMLDSFLPFFNFGQAYMPNSNLGFSYISPFWYSDYCSLDIGMFFSMSDNFLSYGDVQVLKQQKAFNEELAEKQARIDSLQSSVDGMQSTIELLFEEIHSLRESNQNYFDSINGENGYISQINSLNAQLSAANNTIQNLNSQIVALQDEISTLHGNNDNLTNQISQLQQQINELNAELQEAIRERDELQAEVNRYESTFESIGWFDVLSSSLNNVSLISIDGYKSTYVDVKISDGADNLVNVWNAEENPGNGTAFAVVLPRYYGNGTRFRFTYRGLTGSVGGMQNVSASLGYINSTGNLISIMQLPSSVDSYVEFTISEEMNTFVIYTTGNLIIFEDFKFQIFSFDEIGIYDDGFADGRDEGIKYGEQIGYENGYSDARDKYINNDYSFFALISSVLDAPLQTIIGTDEKPGMLNFYIPGLDINIAPFLLSLFSVALVITVIRFILARAS